MRSNPSSCCLEATCLCGEVQSPQTLFATIETIETFGADCPDYNGLVVTLNYRFDGEGGWFGEASVPCGERIEIELICAPTHHPSCDLFAFAWRRILGDTVIDLGDGGPEPGCTCDPFKAVVNSAFTVGFEGCCHFGPQSEDSVAAVFTITE